MKVTREEWIQKRVAEGFTKEYAEREYDNVTDPAIAQAQEQKVPTKADMMLMINEAILNNPDRKKKYNPNFKESKPYSSLLEQLEDLKGKDPYDSKKAGEIAGMMLRIQISGTVSDEELQAEVDKTLEMSIKAILAERKKYEAIIKDCEDKIDNFDMEPVKAKVDALTAEYEKKLKGTNGVTRELIKAEYDEAVEKMEHSSIEKPLNDLAIKRWEAMQFFLVYDARVKYYISANRDLIEEEIVNAKRAEVRGSLAELAEFIEGV